MRKSGLFAIALAAVVATGCGSNAMSSDSSAEYSMSTTSSRAAGGVSNDYTYTEATADVEYDYDSGTEAVADYYDEATLEEMDPTYNAGDDVTALGVDVDAAVEAGADDEAAPDKKGVEDGEDASDDKHADDAKADDKDAEDDKGSKDAEDDGIEEVDTSKKIIRNMNYSVETTDLDALDQAIQDKVSELGGYIEDSSIDGSTVYDDGYYLGDDGNTYYDSSYAVRSGNTRNYRYAYYTIRIPAQKLDQFAQAVEEGANVLSQSTSTQDITSSYVDTDSRRKSLEEELQVLNEMASRAETVDELIQIEAQRSDVRYQLESIRSQLKSMQDRVAYSTVNLSVTEVTVLTDTTAKNLSWQERIVNGFTTSCERLVTTSQEIVIWIASNAPMIVFYIVIAVILLVILRIVLALISAILGLGRGKKARKAARKARAAAQSGAAPVTVQETAVQTQAVTNAEENAPAQNETDAQS